MTIANPSAQKKAPSPREICASKTCRHPRPFHSGDDGSCKAFGCACSGFARAEVSVTACVPVTADIADLDVSVKRPSNLDEYIKIQPGLEQDLRDPAIPHRALATRYEYTTESSVRRWRKAHGVELRP